jgi:hypothetical protein
MTRGRWLAWGLAGAVGLGLGVLSRSTKRVGAQDSWSVSAPLAERTIADSSSYWRAGGFVEMTGPVRPPTTADGDAHVVVYVRLPDGATAHLQPSPSSPLEAGAQDDRPPDLDYPPETMADRVEYYAPAAADEVPAASWLAADVRGTRLVAGHPQVFHVLRPRTSRGGGPLIGLEWPDKDDAAARSATDALGRLMEEGVALGPSGRDARNEAALHLQGLNACASCHVPDRPPRRRMDEHGIVNRGADASGFFQISTVLADRAPLETYRPVNSNLADPYLHFVCGPDETPARLDRAARRRRFLCGRRGAHRGSRLARSARRARSPRAWRLRLASLPVCPSRRGRPSSVCGHGPGV